MRQAEVIRNLTFEGFRFNEKPESLCLCNWKVDYIGKCRDITVGLQEHLLIIAFHENDKERYVADVKIDRITSINFHDGELPRHFRFTPIEDSNMSVRLYIDEKGFRKWEEVPLKM